MITNTLYGRTNAKTIISKMQKVNNNLDMQLALQCAPLICGLKASNLLIIDNSYSIELMDAFCNSLISVRPLLRKNDKTVFILYREQMLSDYISQESIRSFMENMGYECGYIDLMLNRLSNRYREYIYGNGDFPHELGILLGYPIEDVRGFMKNKGDNYLYTGYWKVYEDLVTKLEIFKNYDIARDYLLSTINEGNSIGQIIHSYSNSSLFAMGIG